MPMTLRLSEETERRLEALAAQLNMSKTAIVEQAVLSMDERSIRKARFRAAIERVDERDSDLLDRLSR